MKIDKSAETFGFNLKRLRKKKGFKSQEKLADAIGLSRVVIKAAEEGRSIPQATNRIKIAEALGANEEEFWRDPSEFSPNNQRADKVVSAIKSLLEAAGYQLQDIPELLSLPIKQAKSHIPKDILEWLENEAEEHDFANLRDLRDFGREEDEESNPEIPTESIDKKKHRSVG